jgi:hypothetical protein
MIYIDDEWRAKAKDKKMKLTFKKKLILTAERLEKSKTPKGGYNANQLKVFDIWPPKKGWKKSLIGEFVTLGQFVNFVQQGGNQEYLSEIKSFLESENLSLTKNTEIDRKNKRAQIKKKGKQIKNIKKISRIVEFGVINAIRECYNKNINSLSYENVDFLKALSANKNHTDEEILKLHKILQQFGIFFYKDKKDKISKVGHKPSKKQLRLTQEVYVIRQKSTNCLKIGISNNPKFRLSSLQTASPYELKISFTHHPKKYSPLQLERKLHKYFKKSKKNGEWFENVSDERILNIIKKYEGE